MGESLFLLSFVLQGRLGFCNRLLALGAKCVFLFQLTLLPCQVCFELLGRTVLVGRGAALETFALVRRLAVL